MIVSRAWNFGDGSAVSGDPNPVHTYTTAGSFNATLTVIDNSGLTSASSVAVAATKDIYVNSIALKSSSSTTGSIGNRLSDD